MIVQNIFFTSDDILKAFIKDLDHIITILETYIAEKQKYAVHM